MTLPLDGLRFAFGTLTVLPVRVTRWDRQAARGGMLSAPLVGLVVGGCAAGLGLLLLRLDAGPLLAAVASAAVPAVLTRGLHLDDVYWTEAGRKSVEAVVLTAALVGLLLVGFSPFGVNDMSDEELQDRGGVVSTVVVNFVFSLAVLAKGKAKMAVFSVFVPFVGLVGLIRLARPGSPWARRFYGRRPRARARAVLRAYHHDRRWDRPRRVVGDWLGGKTDAELAQSGEGK
jgi:hypothetical protein